MNEKSVLFQNCNMFYKAYICLLILNTISLNHTSMIQIFYAAFIRDIILYFIGVIIFAEKKIGMIIELMKSIM